MAALILSTFLLLTATPDDTIQIGGIDFIRHSYSAGEGEAALAFADLNNDGHQDLVVTSSAHHDLTLFFGDGQGGLISSGRFAAGENPTDVTAADLNGDGNIDLVIANHETTYLTLLRGDGQGGFRPAANSPLAINVAPHPHAVQAHDLDRDGKLDLIVDHRDGRGLLILRGRGNGAFETPGKIIATGGDPYLGFAVGDLNGDGWLDLVTPNPGNAGVVLSTARPGLAFVAAASVRATAPFGVRLADFDGDGALDLISASGEGTSVVELFRGDGRGGFRQPAHATFRVAAGGKNLAVGDLNGDGFPDAVVCSWASDVLVVLGNAGSMVSVRLRGFENPWGLALADLNEDGLDDFVIADGVRARLEVYLSRRQ